MAVFDAHKNFATATVATAPTPATSGTSLVVTGGQGARFPTPPFNATICPASGVIDPTTSEVVRVTAIATDTLTIVRAQESTTARTVIATDIIFNDVSVKVFTDLETPLQALVVNPLTGWYDAQRQVLPVLPANSAALNITNNNALMAAAPAGSTLYYAGGVYQFNAAWTMPASKNFNFQGQGPGATGANTIFEWTANVAGDIITLPNTFWYWTFQGITFGTSVNQSAGALININGNAGISILNCSVGAIFGGTWNNVFNGPSVGTRASINDQSWNSSLISNTFIGGYKGIGVNIDSSSCSLVISDNCVIQGNWGTFVGPPVNQQALAGVQTSACGALQINDCDILGNQNNLLLSPVSGQVTASVFSTNTYYDNSAGSCIKIAGAGATVRCRFDTCSFTTAGTNYTVTPGTNFSAVEIAGSFAFTATAGQGINLINCNILNTFGTTGTTNGMLVTNAADFSCAFSNFAGWTNGLQVTPIATLNVTKFAFLNNICGTAGGYNGITTGVLVNAGSGAYKTYTIQGNDFNGCTTPISDGGSVSVGGGAKQILQNAGNADGLRAFCNTSGSVLTTTETVVAQVWAPANTLKSGTMIRAFYTDLPGATATTLKLTFRIGVNGTIADAALVSVTSGTATASTTVTGQLLAAVINPGATAAIQGGGMFAIQSAAFQSQGAVATSGSFNSTVGNWISLTAQSGASVTRAIKGGILEVISAS